MAPNDSSSYQTGSFHNVSSRYGSSRPRSRSSRHVSWRNAYEAALEETDAERLFKLVEIAEATALTRRVELEGSQNHHSERQAIEKAVAELQVVKRERLKFR
jgi:hypothetical protein